VELLSVDGEAASGAVSAAEVAGGAFLGLSREAGLLTLDLALSHRPGSGGGGSACRVTLAIDLSLVEV